MTVDCALSVLNEKWMCSERTLKGNRNIFLVISITGLHKMALIYLFKNALGADQPVHAVKDVTRCSLERVLWTSDAYPYPER